MSRTKPAVPRQSLFDPETGAFAVNIRDIGGDDSELRESLKEFGCVKEFPALVDENGVVLVGHRRMKIAEEERIEPVIKKLNLGSGDTGDAERLKLAIVSNIGAKPMTKGDRQRIAKHLYGEREWTMERIAEALNVAQSTITEDLRGLSAVDKPSRPKGGRPKGSRSRKKVPIQTPDPASDAKEPPPPPQASPVEPAKPDNLEPSPPITPRAGKPDAKPDTTSAESEQHEPEREAVTEPQYGYDLVGTLTALYSFKLIGDLAEKSLPAILEAKPPFDYLDLLELGKAIVDLARAWKSHDRRTQPRKPAQKTATPPANDLDGIPGFLRRERTGDNGHAASTNPKVPEV
jgi:hypothetical protein